MSDPISHKAIVGISSNLQLTARNKDDPIRFRSQKAKHREFRIDYFIIISLSLLIQRVSDDL